MKRCLIIDLLSIVLFSIAGLSYSNYENISLFCFSIGFILSIINLVFKQKLTNKIWPLKK